MRNRCRVTFCALTLVGMFTAQVLAGTETGIASVYSEEKTANGEYAHASALTAAHKTLPFGTWVRVTNLQNGLSVIVRINDRGPFTRNRIIDLSLAAARQLGMVQKGSTQVRVEVFEGSGPRADLETR